MLVFNQQANIKNVNGAIADIFANRPAAESTYYIFYSTDTQEIFYDNGAWILIAGTGGGGVNIYNSDGTLTGNRTLTADNFQLTFKDINVFEINGPLLNNGRTIVFDNTSKTYQIGDIDGSFNKTFLEISDINPYIKTCYGSNDIGLKLDFANQLYTLGDPGSFAGGFAFIIDDFNGVITMQSPPGVNGLYFDFANDYYRLGAFSNVNPTFLEVDNANQIIKTQNQGNDIGLKLDFAGGEHTLGDTNILSYVKTTNSSAGIEINNPYNIYLGDVNALGNYCDFNIDIQNSIKTRYNGNDIGLKLDFANQTYQFGQLSFGNTGYKIYAEIFEPLMLFEIVKDTGTLSGVDGLQIDCLNSIYKFGNITGTNNTYIYINDTSELLYTANNGNISNGLYCDFASHVYQFGRATGGNTTYLTIDDAATYPIQIDGTNVLSGSSGGSSGQHLKININGTDYKIKLENP
jgi:hypothetical protein